MRYDVIFVGARSVILIEAGPDYPDFDRSPDELKYDLGGSSRGGASKAVAELRNAAFLRDDAAPSPQSSPVKGEVV